MKRYGDLFSQIVDIDNIREAHRNARKGKTKTEEVLEVDSDVEYYINKLHSLLLNKEYVVGEYFKFKKNDRGKRRDLYKLPYFPDRIVQHAIMQILEPIWKPTLIRDTHQAIKGRGVHSCLKRVVRGVQSDGMKYCLQIDVKNYYPSVDNTIMKDVVRRKIKCKETLKLLDLIIESCEGIPIGNYLSQYLGNLYLSSLDHNIKGMGVKHYYRYCDDVIILSNDKKELHSLRGVIKDHLTSIKLEMKSNYQVYEINKKRGVDCLGYVVYKNKVKIRKRIGLSYFRCNDPENSSYRGWLIHCNSKGLVKACISNHSKKRGRRSNTNERFKRSGV